jgi:hypothetical protein
MIFSHFFLFFCGNLYFIVLIVSVGQKIKNRNLNLKGENMFVARSPLSIIVRAVYKAAKSFCEVVVEELKQVA